MVVKSVSFEAPVPLMPSEPPFLHEKRPSSAQRLEPTLTMDSGLSQRGASALSAVSEPDLGLRLLYLCFYLILHYLFLHSNISLTPWGFLVLIFKV